ncbi:META domain-containing protein [Corynebacterium sp. CNJ-954]|uniref:META domain-containing protein n=1 Tax=Corynebacterium sp. CNJ-954 TaxID=1904962 RepID=UPI000B0E6DAA|nr:META domain-containing protein [Corynebacterium sp. CNJ-954]
MEQITEASLTDPTKEWNVMTLTRKVLTGAVAALAVVGLAGTPTAAAQPELPGSSLPSLPSLSSLPAVPFTGTWVDANPTGGAKVTFDHGRISGTDGCNGVGSSYTVNGNVADVDPFLSTMMACTGPWSQWLQGVSTIHHYGAVLVVHGDDGGVLGVLRPAF